MTDLRKAAEMALEVMEYNRANGTPNMGAAIEALRQALAQPEQEPVLWMMPDGKNVDKWGLQFYGGVIGKPLYTAPPKREWVGLTDEERFKIARDTRPYVADTMRAHEEELKRRNT